MEKSTPGSHSRGKILLQLEGSRQEFTALDWERGSSQNSRGLGGSCCTASQGEELFLPLQSQKGFSQSQKFMGRRQGRLS